MVAATPARSPPRLPSVALPDAARYTANRMLDLIRDLVIPNESKIVLLSLDGLAGLPDPGTGRSELETARLPISTRWPRGRPAV